MCLCRAAAREAVADGFEVILQSQTVRGRCAYAGLPQETEIPRRQRGGEASPAGFVGFRSGVTDCRAFETGCCKAKSFGAYRPLWGNAWEMQSKHHDIVPSTESKDTMQTVAVRLMRRQGMDGYGDLGGRKETRVLTAIRGTCNHPLQSLGWAVLVKPK